ncbi:MAG: YbaB/EbfC family nucleoid-associated protein [Alphaproteobacteria bacterium]
MLKMGKMMKQVAEMQAKAKEMQERIAVMEVMGEAGGGMVQVTLSGQGEARKVKIDPSLVDPAETEMLEDLVAAAINDARTKVDAAVQQETNDLMGGMQLPPGMNLPF